MRSDIGVLGGRGFVGRAVMQAASESDLSPVLLPRVALPGGLDRHGNLSGDLDRHSAEIREANADLFDRLETVRVAVNAAGLALPLSNDGDALWRTNTLLPAVFDLLCREAGIERVIHVSSSSVQGDQSPLNEAPSWNPLSEYAKSKALAEQYLLEHARTRTVIYRATSVMGSGRTIVERLVRFYGGRFVPVFGDGTATLPLAALPNTGAAIVALARADEASAIVLHPSENVTQRGLAQALSKPGARIVRIPVPAVARRLREAANALPGPIVALLRRVDLVVFGQAQEAVALDAIGYEPPVSSLEYLRSLSQVD